MRTNILSACAPRRAAKGITLIELMITIVVLAVLLTIAVPNMLNLIRASRLATAADLLVDTLNFARIEAIKQRKDIQVCTAADPGSANACGSGGNWSTGLMIYDTAAPRNSDPMMRREVFSGDVSVQGPTGPVAFTGTIGSVSSTGNTNFILCLEGRPEGIEVTPHASGRVSKTTSDCSVSHAVAPCPSEGCG
ncbi:MAG: GspH/FimT family pseudopilin [Azonexus sp.]|jgi:type IV fimbrial biogenesis protein FimT|nr:GspH/FimT family pseudopilin [Azonexus sp.]